MHLGLISKNRKIIECPWYKMEKLCKKIIEEYGSLSEKKNRKYLAFVSNFYSNRGWANKFYNEERRTVYENKRF